MDYVVALLVLAGIVYWVRRRRKSRANQSQPASGESDVAAGRRRLPGRNWQCTRCGCEFQIKGDPKSVPRMWWIPSNNSGGKSAWTCPDCGNWSLTVPTE